MNFSKLPVLAAIILVLSLTGLTACSSEGKGTSTQIDTSEAEGKGENGGQTADSAGSMRMNLRKSTCAVWSKKHYVTAAL